MYVQIIDVVTIAAMVPRGMLRLGSLKSPLRFEPAIIPSDKERLRDRSIHIDLLPVTDGK